jgi:erythromycin esterase
MTARRLDYLRRTSVDSYERALRSLRITVTLDAMFRELARGDRQGVMLTRDAALADTVEWILRREDRIVLAAHNGHVQRWPGTMPGMPAITPMGMHLARSARRELSGHRHDLGDRPHPQHRRRLLCRQALHGNGSTPARQPRCADGRQHEGPFATDLRRLSPADAATVRAASQQRAGIGTFYSDQSPLEAFDVIVHLPHVTPAEPDHAALAHAPRDVQEPFSQHVSRS